MGTQMMNKKRHLAFKSSNRTEKGSYVVFAKIQNSCVMQLSTTSQDGSLVLTGISIAASFFFTRIITESLAAAFTFTLFTALVFIEILYLRKSLVHGYCLSAEYNEHEDQLCTDAKSHISNKDGACSGKERTQHNIYQAGHRNYTCRNNIQKFYYIFCIKTVKCQL